MSDKPPTVEEALERLAGRRATNIEAAARVRVVEAGSAQNRHVRRNNLRVALAEARAVRKAAEAKDRAAVMMAEIAK